MNLYGNNLGDGGAEALSKLFTVTSSTSTKGKHLRPIGASLQLLGLGVNDIGPDGAKYLATVRSFEAFIGKLFERRPYLLAVSSSLLVPGRVWRV